MPCQPRPRLRLVAVQAWALSASPQRRPASIGFAPFSSHQRSYAVAEFAWRASSGARRARSRRRSSRRAGRSRGGIPRCSCGRGRGRRALGAAIRGSLGRARRGWLSVRRGRCGVRASARGRVRSAGMTSVNGTWRMRRQSASSLACARGRAFATSQSVNCGSNSKNSLWRNRAAILSPPVICLMRPSASRLPSSTSTETTIRAPARRATSLRMPPSPRRARNVSKSAVEA